MLPAGPSFPKYRSDIDGLRAIAVLAVVAYHSGVPWIGGGFVGVDIFFVISGFLITDLLLRELEATGRINFVNFYARRARRLLPALLIVILSTVILAALLLSSATGEVQRVARAARAALLIWANIYFLRNTEDYFAEGVDELPLLHLWSLSVEEQFYLIWPTILALAWMIGSRFANRRLALAVVAAVVSAGSLWLAFHWSRTGNNWAFYLTPARGWELGLGGLIAIAMPVIARLPRPFAAAASFVGLLLIAGSVLAIESNGSFPIPSAMLPVAGAGLLIIGNARSPDNAAARFLSSRTMVLIGLTSYSWYLWHWPLLSISRMFALGDANLARDVAVSAIAFALAYATWRWVEKPLRFGFATGASDWRVVGAGTLSICVAFAATAGISLWARYAPHSKYEAQLIEAVPWSNSACLLSPGPDSKPDAQCLAANGKPRIVLWGDSLAEHWAPTLVEWAARRGGNADIEILTKSACPPLIGAMPHAVRTGGADIPYEACHSFNDLVIERLAKAGEAGGSGVVLSASFWLRATEFDLRNLGGMERRIAFDMSAHDTKQSLTALETFLRRSLREIELRGLRVVLMLQSPTLLKANGKSLYTPKCLLRLGETSCNMPLATHRSYVEQTDGVLRKLAGEFPNVRLFDPTTVLCRDDLCLTTIDGVVIYKDHMHLRAAMARKLTDDLAPYLNWLAERHEGASTPSR